MTIRIAPRAPRLRRILGTRASLAVVALLLGWSGGTVGAAGATTPVDDKVVAAMLGEYPTSLAGNYLAARFAGAQKDIDSAASYFVEALSDDPANPFLRERAFSMLLANGQVSEAVDLAAEIVTADESQRLAQLVLGVDDMANLRFIKARGHFRAGNRGPLADLTGAILSAWAYQGQKRTDDAIRTIDQLAGPDWYDAFKNYHAGLILEVAGRRADALKRFERAVQRDNRGLRVTDSYARSLMRNKRQADAIQVLLAFDREVPDHPLIGATLKAISGGKAIEPIVADARQGAAELLYGLGAAIGRDGGEEISAIYLQLARHLDDKAELPLVSLSSVHGQLKNYQRAIDYLSLIGEESPLKPMAEIQVGRYYSLLDKFDDARSHLAAIAGRDPINLEALYALGDVYRANKKFKEAAEAYTKVVEATPNPAPSDWALFYYRGICYERTKEWPKAEADFKKALALNPDEAHVLNYLGYSWIDMGMNLDEGLRLVQRAVELRPDDGYIVDSLGWAYYRLQRYEDAVRELEKAVLLKPEDPVINDHLGDAYWKVGRKLEATFQWKHAIDLKPEPEALPAILKKLSDGLTEEKPPANAQTETKPETKAQ